MIIEKIDVRGFGRLAERVFAFSPGLNVILGPNEAGKSTLLQAIQTLLYGHFVDSGVWAGEAVAARFRPWSGVPYAGTVSVRLANDEQYIIHRSFDDEQTTVVREPGGTDVTDRYGPGPHGWVDFADRHLGLTPAVFRASACISQADMSLDRDDVKGLHARLKALADSGGTDQSAEDATKMLDGMIQRRLNPNSHTIENSPLKRAEATVRERRETLKQSRDGIDDLAAIVAHAADWADATTKIQLNLQRLEALVAWHRAEDLNAKLRRLADLDQRISGLHAEVAGLSDVRALTAGSLDEASRCVAEATELRAEVERLTAQSQRESGDRTKSGDNLTAVADELNQLAAVAQLSSADFAAAQLAVDRWQSATTVVREAEDSVQASQRRRAEAQTNRDARLNRVPRQSIGELAHVVDQAEVRRESLDVAERAVAEHPTVSQLEDTYQTLETQVGALTEDDLQGMHAIENDLKSLGAVLQPKRNTFLLGLTATVAVTVILASVFFAIGATVLAVGTIGFGAIAYLLYWFVYRNLKAPKVPSNRLLLDRWLSEYGVTSLTELQRRWDDRLQVQARLAEARALQQTLADARRDHVASLDDLERLTGNRSIAAGQQILDLANNWTGQEAKLDQSEKECREALERSRVEENDRHSSASSALDRLGVTSENPVLGSGSLDRIRRDRERHGVLVERQVELRTDRDRYQQTVQLLADRRSQLEVAESISRGRLAAVGVTADLNNWDVALSQRRERFDAYHVAIRGLDVQGRARQTLVDNEKPEDWASTLNTWRRAAVRPDQDDARTLADLSREELRLREELRAAQVRLEQAEARRHEQVRKLVEPTEVEEQLADATADLARLEQLSNVLQEARSLIRTGAAEHRRMFAPRLGELVSSALDRATNHRYIRAEVDPVDLVVRLDSRERGGLVTLNQVSQGTRDAVALLFRASTVDLLGNPNESAPLFLDDPLVHVDPDRIQNVLEIFRDLATFRQVFYFTQDPRIADWMTQLGPCRVHQLAAPVG